MSNVNIKAQAMEKHSERPGKLGTVQNPVTPIFYAASRSRLVS